MDFLRTINNNIKYDIWGNYLMCRQLGSKAGYEFLARKRRGPGQGNFFRAHRNGEQPHLFRHLVLNRHPCNTPLF